MNFIPDIVRLHAGEAAELCELRGAILDAPHVRLRNLQRDFDDRIDAHLDGLAIAGVHAWPFCEAALEEPSTGAVFTAAVRALEENRSDRLDRLFALTGAVPQTRAGLGLAMGWVEPRRLQGLGIALLGSPDPLRRAAGLAACSMHRVDPGLPSGKWLADVDASVRADALRLVGEVGCSEALAACAAALNDADPECRYWAAWSAVVVGNRDAALDALAKAALDAGPHRRAALRLALQAMSPVKAHRLLQKLARDPAQKRHLVEGSGVSGDPAYLPWLLGLMRETPYAQVAAGAFSLVTGVDLVHGGLDAKPAQGVESGPSENPDDPDVDMDPHEGLPWPDADRLAQWWAAHRSRFPPGTRYFMGAPVTRAHCVDVLRNGYQRQRNLAAAHLCLLEPGTPLFNTSAPGRRQQRQLARMAQRRAPAGHSLSSGRLSIP